MSPWGRWILARVEITEVGRFWDWSVICEAADFWSDKPILEWWQCVCLESRG